MQFFLRTEEKIGRPAPKRPRFWLRYTRGSKRFLLLSGSLIYLDFITVNTLMGKIHQALHR